MDYIQPKVNYYNGVPVLEYPQEKKFGGSIVDPTLFTMINHYTNSIMDYIKSTISEELRGGLSSSHSPKSVMKNGGKYYGYNGEYNTPSTPTWNGISGYKYGGIHINPENEGKFTEQAKRAGMGVQAFARYVLSNKDKFGPSTVKRANFARNASKWKKELGGYAAGEEINVTPKQAEMLRQLGYDFEIINY
jgi:hypothetical protein